MAAYLLDTNILLRLVDPGARTHAEAVRAVSQLLDRNDRCFVTPQVLIEFWSVATRPTVANGLGWDVRRARLELGQLLDQFPLLEETPAVFSNWLALAASFDVIGKRAHDLRLLALMQAHGVDHLLTFNASDFPAGAGITLVDPQLI